MQFLVKQIQFDFEDDNFELPPIMQEEVTNDHLGLWEADDEDDLVDEITCASGWCIKSIDYEHQLVWNVSSVRYVGINKNVKINILVFSTDCVKSVEKVC